MAWLDCPGVIHYMICLLVIMHNITKRVWLSFTVPQADPNTPKPEGRQIIPVKGEPLGVVSNWPPALQAALARWGATQGKSPALTALDITGRPLYTLTYGRTQGFSYADHGKKGFQLEKKAEFTILTPFFFARETVESQRKAGIHTLKQARYQKRTNPQTW